MIQRVAGNRFAFGLLTLTEALIFITFGYMLSECHGNILHGGKMFIFARN
jgi:hypothetical protein